MTIRQVSPTRDGAMTRILAQVAHFPDLRFGDEAALGGLAGAIEQATIRHWLTSETIARSLCSRPWLEVQHEVRAALLVGITQLLFMPREPDHAIVDDAVRWTRGRLPQGAGGFVNAILRKAAALRVERTEPRSNLSWWDRRDLVPCPDGSCVRLASEVFSADPLVRLAGQTSHPVALVTRWSVARGIAETRILAAHGLLQMPLVVHDGSRECAAHDASFSQRSTPHDVSSFHVWTSSIDSLSETLAARPSLLVQDPASAQAVESTRDRSPRRILDACAGRGTKAVQFALLHPNAEVWATDPDAKRMVSLRARAEKFPNMKVVDLAELGALPSHFDLMLLDVPCSNTGVLARRLEARYRFSERSLEELVRLQRSIAEHHRGLVAPKGTILITTCSLEREENQEQAKWLARCVGARVEKEQMWPARGELGDAPTALTDGSYHTLLALK